MAPRRLTLMRINRNADLPLLELEQRSFELDILQALNPRLTATRYGRTWRLSRPQSSEEEPFIWGKLGFEGAERTDSEVIYDEASQDFITSSTRRGSGSFSYFVVDTETQYLIFEEKPPENDVIRRCSTRNTPPRHDSLSL